MELYPFFFLIFTRDIPAQSGAASQAFPANSIAAGGFNLITYYFERFFKFYSI
ncbi:hypothetical protein X474_06370 [Dethiosulfatarculus sandiegensis]|uniref:Uncharacterized protein n=1 Tax=Dethiosulfatarculus sandiegensis TaxID=1429043 RepID=A0A0D2HWL0_9BACT|nr:hypothetical protein X474_06370 [Dethiosulfatarculus sandiegensis]